jgi:hypothetical protein
MKIFWSSLFSRAASWSLTGALLSPLMAFGEVAVVAPAAVSAVLPATPPVAPLPDEIYRVDPPRDYLSAKFVSVAKSIDRFFGDDRNYQQSNGSVIQANLSTMTGYSGNSNVALEAKIKLALPNTEKRLNFVFETNPEKNTVADTTKTHSPPIAKATTPESFAAAIRFEKEEKESWHLSTDGGVKVEGISTTPFARSRASLTVPLDLWHLNVAETVFWFNSIGAGESTLVDFERPISEPLMFRASSNATWLNNSQNCDLRQDFSLYHKVNERAAFLYQASAVGVTKPQGQASDYVVLMLYRYRVHRQWVFFEFSPQLHFPRERDYQAGTLMTMRLEMMLDESR